MRLIRMGACSVPAATLPAQVWLGTALPVVGSGGHSRPAKP